MGGRGASVKSSKKYDDKQIISEKRKNSGFNSTDEFVMSNFDA